MENEGHIIGAQVAIRSSSSSADYAADETPADAVPPAVAVRFSHVGLLYDDGGARVEALRDLSLAIEAGEAVALIGPSGCGKSTTLRMAAGLLHPTQGDVTLDGAHIDAPRRGTAFIPQDLGLFPWKTVLANAAVGLTIRGIARSEARERAREALAQVGLVGFERAYPKSLSGGMRQRLALARALAMDANLVLMDEPLSAIDALLRESLQDTLLELWTRRRHTQILVTHSIEEAVYLGRRIFVISARPGTLVATIDNPAIGSPDYRASAAFVAKCQEIRQALADSSGVAGVNGLGLAVNDCERPAPVVPEPVPDAAAPAPGVAVGSIAPASELARQGDPDGEGAFCE